MSKAIGYSLAAAAIRGQISNMRRDYPEHVGDIPELEKIAEALEQASLAISVSQHSGNAALVGLTTQIESQHNSSYVAPHPELRAEDGCPSMPPFTVNP